MNEHPIEKTIITIPGWRDSRGTEFGRTGRGKKLGKTYTSSVWVYRCCSAIGNSVASMPWQMKVGDEILDENHPAVEKMQTMNSEDNFIDIVRDTIADKELYGYSVWLPNFLGSRFRNVSRLPSSQVTLKGSNGRVTHIEWKRDGEFAEIAREDIILFKNYGAMDMINPDSPAKVAIDKARTDQAIDATVMQHFLNYGIPPYILHSDAQIFQKDMERYKEWWEELFEGIKRRWKIGFVGGGLKPFRLRAPIKELALSELRKEIRTDICGAFGVPPSIIGAVETASKATWKQHMVQFHHNTVNPTAKYMAGILNQNLMPLMFDQPKFEFLPEKVEVLQEERTAKSERIVAEVEAGILTREAAGELLGYQPDQIADAPIDVTREFAERAETRTVKRELKKAAKKNGNLKTFEFRSQILSREKVSSIIEEFKNGND